MSDTIEQPTKIISSPDSTVGKGAAMDSTALLLAERAKTHGSFTTHAETTQKLKCVIHTSKFDTLSDRHKEALHMILHKIGRIMAGNPNFHDHWDDIAGYAKLGSEACDGN